LTLLARRGRRVRVVVGADPQDDEGGRAIVTYLERAGVEVLIGQMGRPLYSRFMVIDKKAVLVGSYPFVDGASSSPLADMVRIDDAALAARYLAFFDYIWTAQR
jgi:phosphatidylserine/phosphatidylglycerophosphate/cardiolipin synthase-like enzyme